MNPRVSIVVPAYNAERFLSIAIDSVLSQTISDWELIIVNDGSKDSTLKIIREYESRDSRIKSLDQANAGVSNARNTGTALTNPQSEFVIFFDQDDIWHSDILEKLIASLDNHPESVGAHSLAQFIDDKGDKISIPDWEKTCLLRRAIINGKIVPLSPEQPTTFASFAIENPIPTPGAVLVRRRALTKVGGFNPDDPQCQDWDLHIRVTRLGPFQFVNEKLIDYRIHGGNASGNKSEAQRLGRTVRRNSINSPSNTLEQKAILQAGFREAMSVSLRDKITYLTDALKKGDISAAIFQVKPILGLTARLLRNSP